jgi:hypothetical protein
MGRGRTLWEMLVDKIQGPIELRHYNPLRARVGGSVMINLLDLKELNFFVKEIREYRRTIGRHQFSFVDYVLLARPLGADDVLVRLRLVPVESDDPGAPTHDALLLRLDDEFAYDEAFNQVVNDTTRKFQVLQDGRVTEEFVRVNAITEPYRAEVALMRDTNHDGTVDRDEVEISRLEYWDYWREDRSEAGLPVRQYLFVEKDADTGWFQIWRGHEVDAQQVMVL